MTVGGVAAMLVGIPIVCYILLTRGGDAAIRGRIPAMSADLREPRRHGHEAGTSYPSVILWGNPIPSLARELDAIASQAILCIVLVRSVGQRALDLPRGEPRCLAACIRAQRTTGDGRMTDRSTDRWLSVEEIAAHLGVKRTSIYKWITRKNMPAHKLGKLWKFRVDEVDEWIRSGKAAQADRDVC